MTTDVNNLTLSDFKIKKMKAEERIKKILKEFTNDTKLNVENLEFDKSSIMNSDSNYFIRIKVEL